MMKTLYALTLAALLALCAFSCSPSHADGWQDKLGAAVIVAPNDGDALGAALTYQVHEHLWADAIFPRWALGASTDMQVVADVIGRVTGLDLPSIPARARVGGTFLGDKFVYFAYGIDF